MSEPEQTEEDDKLPSDIPHRQVFLLTGGQTIAFIVLGLALWIWSGREMADFVTFDFRQLAIGIGLSVALIASGAVLFFGFPELSDRLVRLQGYTYAFLKKKLSPNGVIFVSICAGVGEEALFRGGLQTLLTDHIGVFLGIAVSSAIFALIHMAKPVVAAIIFLIGVTFGVVYWYTESLFAVMLAHALYDIFAIAHLQNRLHIIGFFDQTPKEE